MRICIRVLFAPVTAQQLKKIVIEFSKRAGDRHHATDNMIIYSYSKIR